MENLITAYLFRYKFCPLKKLGTLTIKSTNAQLSLVERSIQAPIPEIVFEEDETLASDFIQFISFKKGISNWEAENLLTDFCKKIKQIGDKGYYALPFTGKFIKTEEGRIQFKQEQLPFAFFPSIPAELVVRPDAVHQVIVGDKETTNTVMAAFYADKKRSRFKSWIYWALGLLLVALAAIFIYVYVVGSNENFGNGQSIRIKETNPTYTIQP